MKISMDAMGGDHAPEALIAGCAEALADPRLAGVALRLHGPADRLGTLCAEHGLPRDRCEIIHAPAVITNHEAPTAAIRQKPDSSLVSALLDVREKRAEAFVSAGSTGAVLAGSVFRVGRLPGVARPALAPLMPTAKGKPVLVLDIGANVDCKPGYLAQFGMMGSIFMRQMRGVDRPKVGLLNIGAEAEKGNELAGAAYPLLQAAPIDFAGNAEARYAFSGDYDVIVTDGFAGNILLKGTEGAAAMIFSMLRESIGTSFSSKIGAVLMKKSLRILKKKLDYTEYGGSLLLGIDGIIIKAHGSSNARAFSSAIRQAHESLTSGVLDRLREAFSAAER